MDESECEEMDVETNGKAPEPEGADVPDGEARESESGREEIDRFLAQLDEEAIAEETELQRELEKARRPRWWTFGIRTFVP